ncbi:MAG TPA: cupredoxin family copper-binding protein [Vitreimonas sp.]|jgi:plastocyanin|nr:cupredoxin family copper-binding protein [Vitreimonas sp.]
MDRSTSFGALVASALIAGVVTICAINAHAQAASMHDMHNMAATPMGTGPAVMTNTVQIRDFSFIPRTIVVTPGTTVTWTNVDDEPHTVTANDRAYHSAAMDTDQTYTHTFATAGEFHYFCALHPHMTATVIVRAPGATQGH